MTKQTRFRGANVGTVFTMVIFVLLCLTTFATLSLVSAKVDHRLTMRSQDALVAYYQADTAAVLAVDAIDSLLVEYSDIAVSEDDYLTRVSQELLKMEHVTTLPSLENRVVELSIDTSERQTLFVTLELSPLGETTSYTITRWQLVLTGEWMPEGQPNLWDGLLGGF